MRTCLLVGPRALPAFGEARMNLLSLGFRVVEESMLSRVRARLREKPDALVLIDAEPDPYLVGLVRGLPARKESRPYTLVVETYRWVGCASGANSVRQQHDISAESLADVFADLLKPQSPDVVAPAREPSAEPEPAPEPAVVAA